MAQQPNKSNEDMKTKETPIITLPPSRNRFTLREKTEFAERLKEDFLSKGSSKFTMGGNFRRFEFEISVNTGSLANGQYSFKIGGIKLIILANIKQQIKLSTGIWLTIDTSNNLFIPEIDIMGFLFNISKLYGTKWQDNMLIDDTIEFQ